jgi:hypothetical protein
MTVNNNFEMTYEEVIWAKFDALHRYLPGRTEEKTRIRESGESSVPTEHFPKKKFRSVSA